MDPVRGHDARRRRFLRDTLSYLPSSLIPAAVSVASVSIFTRLFSPHFYGLYGLVTAGTAIAIPLLGEWAAQPAARYYAEYQAHGEIGVFSAAVGAMASLILYAAALVALLAAGVSLVLYHAIWHPWLLAGALLVVGTHALATVITPILPASFQAGAYNQIRVVSSVLALGVQLALIAVLGRDVAWILWGSGAVSAATLPWMMRRAGIRLAWRPRVDTAAVQAAMGRFWRYGGPMGLWFLSSTLLYSADRFVINGFIGASAVGIYTVNYNLVARLMGLIKSPINNASFPVLMQQWARRELQAARETLAAMTTLYLELGVGLVGLMVVVAGYVVDIVLGAPFRVGYEVMVPVLAGVVVWGASNLGHKTLEFVENTRLMMVDGFLAAGVNIGLNLWLVPRYGYVAAAYVTLATYLFYTVLIWFQVRSVLPWDIQWKPLAWSGAAALLAIVACARLVWPHPGSPWTNLMWGVGLFGVPYGLMVFGPRYVRGRAA